VSQSRTLGGFFLGIGSGEGALILRKLIVPMMAHSERPKMRKLLVGLLITGSLAFTPRTAVAGSGEVAAGVVGGLAVGTLLGAAAASGPRYYQPAPVYVAPAPVYVAPTCYWTRGEPVWDGYRGIWYRPRIQVCD
jgi:hypothetical protein